MNLSYLKYAVEVEKTGSITKAAQNFYMNQPHLSKIIRELERELGEDIFDRTSRGMIPTKKGEEFLRYAKPSWLRRNRSKPSAPETANRLWSLSSAAPEPHISPVHLRIFSVKPTPNTR